MTAFPAHPAWDFVVRLYGAPGVAPACLDLQERHGIDVTMMLFCLWRGAVDERSLGTHLPALMLTARAWHHAAVLPIRAARRWLKAQAKESVQPAATALYKTVLAAEIDCEHGELLMLAQQAEAACGTPGEGPFPAAMAANLAAFFEASGVGLTQEDRPALTTILAAAGAGEAIERVWPPGPRA